MVSKRAVRVRKESMVRVTYDFKEELEKEAAADGRDLSNYIRHLLVTHPGRKRENGEKQTLAG